MSVIKPTIQQPDQIAYFAGANNYCWTHFRDGKKKLLAKPISYLETLLPDFIRVHKTALVNPSYVEVLRQPPRRKMNGEIHLDDGTVLPVSRRRWDYVVGCLQNYTQSEASRQQAENSGQAEGSLSIIKPLTETSAPTIYLITTHQATLDSAHNVFKNNGLPYDLYTSTQSTFLPPLLLSLPEHEFPALLLLDARTAAIEQLRTLSELKTNKRLCSLPVILFVAPTDQAIINGYRHQANSVISLPVNCTIPNEVLERICLFWLHMVKLPVAEDTGNRSTGSILTTSC